MKILLMLLVSGLTGFVSPFIGTDGHGHTFPGATYPFGMVQLSPDTRLEGWDGCSGYHYSDKVVYGFSHTHLSGTGCSDYGDILLMPVEGYVKAALTHDDYSSGFSHDSESAKPGYYSVHLDRWNVDVELTAGRRTGMHRYTFKGKAKPEVMMDFNHRDSVIGARISVTKTKTSTIVKGLRRSYGWSGDQPVFYYIVYSAPAINVWQQDSTRLLLQFPKQPDGRIIAKIGISSVSEENAKANLDSEMPEGSFDFEVLRRSTLAAWEKYLDKIEIPTEDKDAATTFYTALYHTAMAPNVMSDVNGEYYGHDKQVHKAVGYDQYTVFSLWDTFRALHPLMAIIEPERTSDFISSFLAIYSQSGRLPVWELWGYETECMIGFHSVPVIVDAYAKGIRDFDADLALDAMVASANYPKFGLGEFNQYGYVPADKARESVSKTQEYAFDDWCIASFAKKLADAKMNKLINVPWNPDSLDAFAYGRYKKVYEEYIGRASYWKNLFDPETHFMRPRFADGSWLTPFNPKQLGTHYTEGNAWQYSFMVPQDIDTFIKMYGGDKAFCERLDSLFNTSSEVEGFISDVTGLIGQYAQGNEPSHHMAYLYSYAGEPEKTAYYVDRICKTLYGPGPDGLCGNEDCGQMSAWYVFSALGFYPVTPGSDIYVIGTPQFDRAIIHLSNGNRFTINAKRTSSSDIYVQSATCGSYPENYRSFITHDQITAGEDLFIVLGPKAGEKFGRRDADRPHAAIDFEPSQDK